MNIIDMVRESNRIEGITRDPTHEEIEEHARFTRLKQVTIEELSRFIGVYQPNAVLRERQGLNVQVGGYFPPPGGVEIRQMLDALLVEVNAGKLSAWHAHVRYECIHPFTDGNGRSGRALWYWIMVDTRMETLGFLHAFYYQTLRNSER